MNAKGFTASSRRKAMAHMCGYQREYISNWNGRTSAGALRFPSRAFHEVPHRSTMTPRSDALPGSRTSTRRLESLYRTAFTSD